MKTPHVSLGLRSRDFVVQVKMTQDTGLTIVLVLQF